MKKVRANSKSKKVVDKESVNRILHSLELLCGKLRTELMSSKPPESSQDGLPNGQYWDDKNVLLAVDSVNCKRIASCFEIEARLLKDLTR